MISPALLNLYGRETAVEGIDEKSSWMPDGNPIGHFTFGVVINP